MQPQEARVASLSHLVTLPPTINEHMLTSLADASKRGAADGSAARNNPLRSCPLCLPAAMERAFVLSSDAVALAGGSACDLAWRLVYCFSWLAAYTGKKPRVLIAKALKAEQDKNKLAAWIEALSGMDVPTVSFQAGLRKYRQAAQALARMERDLIRAWHQSAIKASDHTRQAVYAR